MSDSAKITSLDAVLAFAVKLREFRELVNNILLGHARNVQRLEEMFSHELPRYWSQRTRHCYDQVDRTRAALSACRMRNMDGEAPSCFEEKEAYDAARRRLQRVEQMGEVLRHWHTKLSEESEECRGRMGKFRRVLDVDLEKTISLVDRILTSLEGYVGRSIREPENQETKPPEEQSPG